MNRVRAAQLFERARRYCEANRPDDLVWAANINADTFRTLESRYFLNEYCYVVYASGFRAARVEALFPQLRRVYKEFDLEALSRMRSIVPAVGVFKNERKARAFLTGARQVAAEGFPAYKRRLGREGVDMLEELPGVGPITKFHLAKNIGLVDEAKPDLWLVRFAGVCEATVPELVGYLSEKYRLPRLTVDVILWRYGVDNGVRKA